MEQSTLESLIHDIRKDYGEAKRATNGSISLLTEQIKIETEAHEKCLMHLEKLRLQLIKIDLQIVKEELERKLTTMNAGYFVNIE